MRLINKHTSRGLEFCTQHSLVRNIACARRELEACLREPEVILEFTLQRKHCVHNKGLIVRRLDDCCGRWAIGQRLKCKSNVVSIRQPKVSVKSNLDFRRASRDALDENHSWIGVINEDCSIEAFCSSDRHFGWNVQLCAHTNEASFEYRLFDERAVVCSIAERLCECLDNHPVCFKIVGRQRLERSRHNGWRGNKCEMHQLALVVV